MTARTDLPPPATGASKPLYLTSTLEESVAAIARVEQLLSENGTPCRPGSALAILFSKVKRINEQSKPMSDERWRPVFIQANEAARIARSIEAALEDPGSKAAIDRVTRSDMNLSTRQRSQGKDALFELDLYRRFKLGKVEVRFEEPDLVVSLGNRSLDYGVACKKVYSEANVASRFKDGCRQLRDHGRQGVVAFNLDDLTPANSVWKESEEKSLQLRMETMNREFIYKHKEHFSKAIARGECDGILVCTSVISDVQDMALRINTSWSTAVWTDGSRPDAQQRLDYFRGCLDRALSA
jgi:hypothetical protein